MASSHLTRFAESFIEDRQNHYLRFGSPVRTEQPEGRKVHVFAPGARFGAVYWSRNKYGTQEWAVTILRACAADQPLERVPNVAPGAEILLHAYGRGKAATDTLGPAQRALKMLDEIEAAGAALDLVSEDYWRSSNYRIRHRGDPLFFVPEQHLEAVS